MAGSENSAEINLINQRCYDNRADYWDRFPFIDFLPGLLNKYYRPVLGNKVLDIGSGTGMLAKWLADSGFDVVCLDPSPEMVQRCLKKGLNITQATIQDYQPNTSFGMIFAILSLIHVPKKEMPDQIQKMASALDQGGLLFLALIEGKKEEIREYEGGYPRFFANYSRDEIVQLLQGSFRLLEFRRVNGSTNYLFFVFQRV